MRHVLAAALVLLLVPASASAAYDPAGVYLDALTWPRIADRADVQLDAAGLPQVKHGDDYVYNPVTIAQYGLQEWSYNAAGQGAEHLTAALHAADWLVAHQESLAGTWSYGYDFPVAGMGVTLHAPWISAMAQGQAMSLLTRAWRSTGGAQYLAAADAALAPFRLSVPDGGVVTGFLDDDAHPFYEEYPTQPASLTLNGFMFSLLGLYDLGAAAPGGDAAARFDEGFATLVAGLPKYDTGGVSAYHLGHLTNAPRPVHSSVKYHWIHVVELTALDSVRPDPVLERYRDRWPAYKPSVKPRKPPPSAPPPPPPPAPVVSGASLARPVRTTTRRAAVRFALSAAATVRLDLFKRVDGTWHARSSRSLALPAGEHTVGVYRAGRRAFRPGAYSVVVSAGASAERVRFRCRQRSRKSGSSSGSAAAAARSRSSSRS